LQPASVSALGLEVVLALEMVLEMDAEWAKAKELLWVERSELATASRKHSRIPR